MDWNKVDKTFDTVGRAADNAGKVVDTAARVGKGLLGGFFLLVGIGMFIWSVYWFNSRVNELDTYTLTTGTVVELEKSRDDEGGWVYSPNVSFKDKNGVEYIYNSGHASDPPSYEIGEKVELYYNSADPGDAFINSFIEKWMLGIVLVIVGLVLVPIGIWLIISAIRGEKRAPQRYTPNNEYTGVRIG